MGKSLTMGRNRDLELPLPDMKLSRRHCQILYNDEQCILKDLGSTNGTFVNGLRLSGQVELNDFDRIVLGDTEIEFHHDEKVPLPHNAVPDAADPFGLDDELLAEPAPSTGESRTATRRQSQPAPPLFEQAKVKFDSGPAMIIDTNIEHLVADATLEPEHISAAVAANPLAEALHEMMLPLPPEPPPLNLPDIAANRPRLVFCEACEGSITMLDLDLSLSKEVNGKMYCKECLAAGAHHIIDVPLASHAPALAPARHAPSREKSVDDMLAALEDEAVVVDTTLKRGGRVLDEEQTAKKVNAIQKVQGQFASVQDSAQTPPHKVGPVSAPKPSPKVANDDFGDEFEEIG